jgi:hypothetical protein
MVSTDTKAVPERPVPPTQPPKSPPTSRRRWPLRLLILFLILFCIPIAVLTCLSFQDTSLSLDGAGATAVEVGCPTETPPFTDCYTRILVSVLPVSGAASEGVKFCCDFVAERRSEPILSIDLSASSQTHWSSLDTPGRTWVLSKIADGGTAATFFQYRRSTEPMGLNVTLSGPARTSLPLLGRVVSEEITRGILDRAEAFAARLPPAIGEPLRWETVPATLRVFAAKRSNERPVVGRAGDRDIVTISANVEISRSVLFNDRVNAIEKLSGIGAYLVDAPLPSPRRLRGLILEQARSPATMDTARAPLRRAATTISLLEGMTVSRLSRLAEETQRMTEAGQHCVALYRDLRAGLSRLDAALTTYAAALPSGLLARHPGQFDHGCTGVTADANVAALTEDWRVLGLALPEIEAPLEDTDAAANGVTSGALDANQTTPAGNPRRFLLSVAAATKSGARLDQLEAALAETLTVRIGEAARYESRDRGDVIRLLHHQWSHAGCWLYDTGDGAGTLTLHVEAQFPYLNHIAFRLAETGLITAIEITGVTLRELVRVKRQNQGKGCQAFLEPTRIADYASWLGAEGAGARTPVDHALRLLEDGPGAAGKLKFR